VKSTLLIASVAALKESGYFAAYYDRLDARYEAEVLDSVAGAWVSLNAALAHYRACDALALTSAEQMTVGRRTGNGLQRHLTHIAGMVSRNAGVAPWWWLEHFNRFWARTFDGGGIAVTKLGPKEAEVRYAGCALLESSYFRSALRGVATGLLASVTHRSFMSELPACAGHHEVRYRFSWV
jgi:hypothetical protein